MSQQTILVVEDEENLAEALKFNLERQGYAVVVENDGYGALRAVESDTPDVILLDVMLPGPFSGYRSSRVRHRCSPSSRRPLRVAGERLRIHLARDTDR